MPAGILKTHLILLLIAALVLAQGLRLCVHAPDTDSGGAAHASLVHYESDSVPAPDDACHEFALSYVVSGLDFHNLLAGLSAFALLLISLLLVASQARRIPAAFGVALRPSGGARLRPPLRAPPL